MAGKNIFPFFLTIAIGANILFLNGCTGSVEQLTQSRRAAQDLADRVGMTPADAEMESEVSKQCLTAWRLELKGDEKEAMALLNTLNQKYPKLGTVELMMGQVMDHAGKPKEAIKFYKEAVRDDEFSSIHTFKLAEALRTTGDAAEASVQYRKLINAAPDFLDARLGLAKSLLVKDKNSSEARLQIAYVLEKDPANKEAKNLSSQMKVQR
jgi:tetratricopeptide (TPR) repeat protein